MTKKMKYSASPDKLKEYVEHHKKFLIANGKLTKEQKSRIKEIEDKFPKVLTCEEANELGAIYKIAQDNVSSLTSEELEKLEKKIQKIQEKDPDSISKTGQDLIKQFNARGSFLEFIATEENTTPDNLDLYFDPNQDINFDLSGADLSNISFSDVHFLNPLNESVNMRHCNLRNTTFHTWEYTSEESGYKLKFNFPNTEEATIDETTKVKSLGFISSTEHTLNEVMNYDKKDKVSDDKKKEEYMATQEAVALAGKTVGTSALNNATSLNTAASALISFAIVTPIAGPVTGFQVASAAAAVATTVSTAKECVKPVTRVLMPETPTDQQKGAKDCKALIEKDTKELKKKKNRFTNHIPNKKKIIISLVVGAAIALAPLTAGASVAVAAAVGVASVATTYVVYGEVADKMQQAKENISSYFTESKKTQNSTTKTEPNADINKKQQTSLKKEAKPEYPASPEPTPVTNHEQQLSARRSKSSQDNGRAR